MASFLSGFLSRTQEHRHIFTLANASWQWKTVASRLIKPKYLAISGTSSAISTTVPNQGHVLRQIFRTIRAAWYRKKPRLVGTDSQGNRFFEAPPNKGSEHSTKSSRSRRFVLVPGQTSVDDSWMSLSGDFPDLSPEWYAWLRHKRMDPPNEAEIKANAAAISHRQLLARQLEAKYEVEREKMIREGLIHDNSSSSSTSDPKIVTGSSITDSGKPRVPFPVRPTLETVPGEGIASGKKFRSE